MPVCVWLFGLVRATTPDGSPVHFPTAKCRDLLAVLCLAGGRELPRTELARTLWPSARLEVAAVNLRVALYSLKRALDCPDALVADRSRVRIDARLVRTDLERVVELRRLIAAGGGTEHVACQLGEVAEATRYELLAGVDLPVALDARTAWRQRHLAAMAQLREWQEANGKWDEAITTAADLIECDPTHEEAISATLRLFARRGQTARALDFFARANSGCVQRTGVGLSAETARLASDIKAGRLAAGPSLAAPIEADSRTALLGAILEDALARGSDAALMLLADETRSAPASACPAETLKVIGGVIDRAALGSSTRTRLASGAARMANLLNLHEEVVRWAEVAVVEGDPDDPQRFAAMVTRGFSHFAARNWDAARLDLTCAYDGTASSPSSVVHLAALLNLALLDWHQLRFGLAKDRYRQFFRHADQGQDGVASQVCMAKTNLCYLYSVEGDWESVLTEGESALRFSRTFGFAVGESVCGPLGLAHVVSGDAGHGVGILERGLASMSRHGYSRLCEICLDYAALAFARLGHFALAEEVLWAASRHRSATFHDRSPAEELLVSEFLPCAAPTSTLAGHGPRELVAFVGQRLAELH